MLCNCTLGKVGIYNMGKDIKIIWSIFSLVEHIIRFQGANEKLKNLTLTSWRFAPAAITVIQAIDPLPFAYIKCVLSLSTPIQQ